MKECLSTGWVLVACLAASSAGAGTSLSVHVELNTPRNVQPIELEAPFRVVVTNNSDKPFSIWNPQKREGYYQFSFHFVNVRIQAEHVARKVESTIQNIGI